eukprot:TRINITY_DN4380_c0_g1_i1.p4 TRINITY_DN4380_c0_g1~~TRINITY_DN4380_c0_g1_i1.p4  ORF type:complete len:125 (-),score=15.77 TRINITY_DN4380_c0_g1_i1:516-890(-)
MRDRSMCRGRRTQGKYLEYPACRSRAAMIAHARKVVVLDSRHAVWRPLGGAHTDIASSSAKEYGVNRCTSSSTGTRSPRSSRAATSSMKRMPMAASDGRVYKLVVRVLPGDHVPLPDVPRRQCG